MDYSYIMFSGHTFPSGVTAMLVRCISTGDTGSCLCCNFAQAASWFFQQVYSVFLTVLLMFPPHWRTLSGYWHVSVSVDMSTCGDMCRYVLACADMCQHVTLISATLIAIIKTLSTCRHVSAPVDMPTCADMCRHVPACANMCNHSQHLWYQPFETYLECWYVTAHLDMLACVDMCWHVPTCANMWH